jgi:hypothetical protein
MYTPPPSACNGPTRFLSAEPFPTTAAKFQSQKLALLQPIPQTLFLQAIPPVLSGWRVTEARLPSIGAIRAALLTLRPAFGGMRTSECREENVLPFRIFTFRAHLNFGTAFLR